MYDELVKRLRHDSESRALMVDAADAIEELQEDNAALNGTVSNLIGQIAELRKPNWIPVTERLPGREWVLCKCRANIYEVLSLRDGYWYHDPQHQYMRWFVTHWMPLPEPPKEET